MNSLGITEEPEKTKPIIIACKRQSYNFFLGDTFKKFEPIPLASRGWQHRDSRGDYFTIYPVEEYVNIDFLI